MSVVRTCLILAAALLAVPPLLAQGGQDTGRGTVPLGREGAIWQTRQGLELEELKAFEAELEGLSEEEWKERAIAWLAFDVAEGAVMTVAESYHVAGLDAGKKATVAMTSDDEDFPEWEISFGKKKPNDLDVTMTDRESTRVACPLGETFRLHVGHLGVFVRDAELICMTRGSDGAAG